MLSITERTIGLNFNSGQAVFSLWSPFAEKIELVLNDKIILSCEKLERGYWCVCSDKIMPGDFYRIRINGEKDYPDPASLSQPQGVHGSSQAFDIKSFEWHDRHWEGLQEENIFYELHTGTFSENGDFDGIAARIEYLRELGVNTIEIMPVAQFPGSRNWGYDGVFPFAVQQSYGGASSLMDLIDRCHSHGIAVVLDVVYNHLGPEGNYLNVFGPYFTDAYKTPWGRAINFDGEWSDGVREFYIENMLMWLRDFHLDGLRLDAVHAIKDFSPKHIIKELREKADELGKVTGRKYILIGEVDLNDTKFINPADKGGFNLDKQWCDEFHHALHALVTGERNGYYSDFGDLSHFVKSLNNAYVYDGIWSEHRKRTFGTGTEGIPGNKFVVFTQNHDHIGNRMLGERIGSLVDFEVLKVIAGAMFISPFDPLIFMGEEYNEHSPFLYFTSHTDRELAELVSRGRKNEFPYFMTAGVFPEPQSEEVFNKSKLSFDLSGKNRQLFDYYRELIRLKKTHPVWKTPDRSGINATETGSKTIVFSKQFDNNKLIAVLNFAEQDINLFLPGIVSCDVIINSSEKCWGGNTDSKMPTGENGLLTIHGSSFIVFSNLISL